MAKVLRFGLIAVFALVLVVPAANAAVEKGDFILGPTVQVGLPLGDFSDLAGFGFGFGAIGDYLVTDNVAIGGDFVYNFFSSELDSDLEDVDFDSPKVLQIGAHAKMFFNPMEDTNPFIFGGLALYNMKQSASVDFGGLGSFGGSVSSTEFGFNGGGGAQFKAGENMRLAAQGHIHIIMSDPSAMYVGGAVTLLFGLGGN